jgi:hypothetical protein
MSMTAIMDTCASVVTLIGGLAGGPGGAFIAAFISIVAQIIKFADKKSEPERTQFETLMREMQSELKLVDIQTAQIEVNNFKSAVNIVVKDAKNGGDIASVREVIGKLNNIEGNAIHAITQVRLWLQIVENQDLPRWQDVIRRGLSDLFGSNHWLLEGF